MQDKKQKIIPHLWFDKEALEAARFYTGLFENSSVDGVHTLENTPSGDAEAVEFTLAGQSFAAISAGPYFKLNPSISFMVTCGTTGEVDRLWNALIDGGSALMALGEYPYSKRYGWVVDRYGLSWQLLQADSVRQKIRPNLLFSGDDAGRAEEAIRFYAGIFSDSSVGQVSRYAEGEAASGKAAVKYVEATLRGYDITAMDNAYDADVGFNEAVSFMVQCRDQSEIDYYWDKLSAVPEAEQCGWVKDQFGVSWQILPDNMVVLLYGGTREENLKATEAMLKMKKLDIAALEAARRL
jgi:predicted 3-demethylubiquinone-9 3-methyltransferase (glyoxalase superfamily)